MEEAGPDVATLSPTRVPEFGGQDGRPALWKGPQRMLQACPSPVAWLLRVWARVAHAAV